MTKQSEELTKTIADLHRQLSELDHVDPAVRGSLASILHDVERALKKPSGTESSRQSLVE
jgi:hypothetical protein